MFCNYSSDLLQVQLQSRDCRPAKYFATSLFRVTFVDIDLQESSSIERRFSRIKLTKRQNYNCKFYDKYVMSQYQLSSSHAHLLSQNNSRSMNLYSSPNRKGFLPKILMLKFWTLTFSHPSISHK